jgi:aromatic ring-opening dioxygenase LigB subunit
MEEKMDNLVFACIAPHGGITLPLLAGVQACRAEHTRLALEDLGRRMAEAAPDTIVLITPHGYRVDGVFSLLNNRRVQGTLAAEEGGNANSLTLGFRVDQPFNEALRIRARELGVPVSRIGYAVADEEAFVQELDWGALIPLWFMGASLVPQPDVVIACPDRGNLTDLPWELFPRFGQAIRETAEVTGRRIALIASADLGHAHDPDGPYGFHPASAEFDAAVQEAICAQDLGRLLHFDRDWVTRAATDAFGQILNLHGAIQGTGLQGELLSYEVPTYFGMVCAAYHLPAASTS